MMDVQRPWVVPGHAEEHHQRGTSFSVLTSVPGEAAKQRSGGYRDEKVANRWYGWALTQARGRGCDHGRRVQPRGC
jgi:hypothetical protein